MYGFTTAALPRPYDWRPGVEVAGNRWPHVDAVGRGPRGVDVLTVGDVPHALLFPRPAAVVHHAGAGTSAAAPRAGVPAGTVGQPFRAGRLASIGAATDPIPFRSLTAERLADALDRVVRQRTCSRAAALAARHMATEGGAGQALKVIQWSAGGWRHEAARPASDALRGRRAENSNQENGGEPRPPGSRALRVTISLAHQGRV